MQSINPLPLAVGHMIGMGAIGSCLGIGITATGIGLWFALANPLK